MREQPDSAAAELSYLRSPRAIRDRCETLYSLALAGELEHFAVDEDRLDGVVDPVLQVTRDLYPDLDRIPYHGRFRHFGAGGIDRLARFDRQISGLSREEQLMARFELVITSVLLDAGAGERWSYQESSGARYARSEGLAVASYDWFAAGGLSSEKLVAVTPAQLAAAFQV